MPTLHRLKITCPSSQPMSGRDLPAGLYFLDDLQPGDRWVTGGMLVQDWHILTFAGLTGDFFDVHMDDRFAQGLGFDGRIAHGSWAWPWSAASRTAPRCGSLPWPP